MDYKQKYQSWLEDPAVNDATKAELRAIAGDEAEIEDRFYKELEFGTGGMRGVLGAGANRLNIYTIRKATQGLVNYILKNAVANDAAVAIAYDSRRMSPEFCEEAALVLNGNGIKTYVFDSLRPTPALSFAVRYLKCVAGIVVTASHNPANYNGYKVYWSDGGQVPYPRDEAIIHEVDEVKRFFEIKLANKNEAVLNGLYNVAGSEVDDAYVENVLGCSVHPGVIKNSDLKIVYTPLHGSGNVPVRRALSEAGFKNVFVVKEQELPDGNFPTVKLPNPEDKQAFALALKLAEEKNADIIIATDPDADRVGAAVRNVNGEFEFLTGNMTGVLLTEYLLSGKKETGTLPPNGAVISTIVSTAMTKKIAEAYGAEYIDVLTGFKYIGEKIKEFEEDGSREFVFGFEESYGCLSGTYARDKDAVAASMLICEAAAYFRAKGMTLRCALDELYMKYGYYGESVESIALAGVEGLADMKKIMAGLRAEPPKELAGAEVTEASDYLNGITRYSNGESEAITLPVSDVLHYKTADGSWACVRPSGTEPKIKLYFGTRVDDKNLTEARVKAGARLAELSLAFKALVNGKLS